MELSTVENTLKACALRKHTLFPFTWRLQQSWLVQGSIVNMFFVGISHVGEAKSTDIYSFQLTCLTVQLTMWLPFVNIWLSLQLAMPVWLTLQPLLSGPGLKRLMLQVDVMVIVTTVENTAVDLLIANVTSAVTMAAFTKCCSQGSPSGDPPQILRQ